MKKSILSTARLLVLLSVTCTACNVMKTLFKQLALLLLLGVPVMALTGCVHSRTLNPSDSADPSFAGINRLAARKMATITLADNRAIRARNLQVTPDSSSWLNVKTHQFERVATAQIKEIRFVKRGRGALEGLGIGLLSGAAVGAVIGYAACPCTSWSILPSDEEYSRGYGAGVGVRVGGFLGGFLGILVGPLSGSKQVYRFEAPAPAPPMVVEDVEQQIPRRE